MYIDFSCCMSINVVFHNKKILDNLFLIPNNIPQKVSLLIYVFLSHTQGEYIDTVFVQFKCYD